MKVIHISASYKPAYIYGGPIMSVAQLCQALTECNTDNQVEVEVLTTTANGKTELNIDQEQPILIDGVKVFYFKRLTKDHTHFSITLLWRLWKEIMGHKKAKTELVIHIHAWWNLVSILSCQISKYHHIEVILSPRGMLTKYTLKNKNVSFKSIIHNIIGKRLLKYCHIHATTEKEKKDILQLVKPVSITVIPNLVFSPKLINSTCAPSLQQHPFPTKNNTFKLIFLSRIEQKKGIELLLESLSRLTIDWSLTIAGNGDQEYLNHLKLKAKKLSITEHLTWLGHVNNANKFNLIAAHELLLLTSYNENFANVVIESLSVGTPVLISREVGLSDYVEANQLGWTANLNQEEISKAIVNAYNNINARYKIRNTAPQKIAADFDKKVLVRHYTFLYKKALDH